MSDPMTPPLTLSLQKGYLIYNLGATNNKQVYVELRKRGFLEMESNTPSAAGQGTLIAAFSPASGEMRGN
jgi:hypothetical protein